MHIYIVFAHPPGPSFNREVLEAFSRGLSDSGHTFEIGDLYAMNFRTDMDSAEYRREVSISPTFEVPPDVLQEQQRVNRSDALAFIFPLWWSDCPAKLKGWFDRVWTNGFAYFYTADNQRQTRIRVKKALVICSAGHTVQHLEETGIAESMRHILLQDRLIGVGITDARLEILGGMMPGDDSNKAANLQRAYQLGKSQ